jgi:hypothetical protein
MTREEGKSKKGSTNEIEKSAPLLRERIARCMLQRPKNRVSVKGWARLKEVGRIAVKKGERSKVVVAT